MNNLVVSFSGGETSAYMTQWIMHNWADRFDNIKVVFANTGQEHEETLKFVERCSDHFGFEVTWFESVVQPGFRKPTLHKIVDFETASRDGSPFEAVIKKFGIPNQVFKGCTRELKLNPINSFVKRDLKWLDPYTAIGIRIDEVDRISVQQEKRKLLYPLAKEHPMTKPQINWWWSQQPFRLNLKHYQGNCTWRWKKTMRKHFTLLSENPEFYDFPERMERDYGLVGSEFTPDKIVKRGPLPEGYRRTFFRGKRSVQDLKRELAKTDFDPYHDDTVIFDPILDVGGGCGESCEVYGDED